MGHPQARTQTGSPPNNENPTTVIPVRFFHNIVHIASLNAYTRPFFQAASMPLDRGRVFAHIDKNLPQHIAKVQELVRQPSISPENKGVRDCANLVLSYLTSLGAKASLEETSGNPVVYGNYDSGADKTIVVYMMYDTMPIDEPGWRVDPLAGTLTDVPPFGRCLVARGAFNTKGELRGFLNACESIKDFYRHAQVPNKEDRELLPKLEKTFNDTAVREEMKVDRFIGDSHGIEALKKYLFEPTLNINGIASGYTGPETKTLLPHKITVKMDVRLVPNMRKDDVIPMIRNHLDAYGFKDIQIRILEAGYGASRTSYQSPPAQAVIKSYKEMGKDPELWPTIAGSAPFAIFNRKPVNLPVVIGGLGHGALAHSPNEYIVIDENGPTGGLASMEKSFVTILDNFGKMVG